MAMGFTGPEDGTRGPRNPQASPRRTGRSPSGPPPSRGVPALLAAVPGLPRGGEPTEALTIRLVRPDQQLERLIGLFRGTRAPHPAAALSAWKRAAAAANPRGLGKSWE